MKEFGVEKPVTGLSDEDVRHHFRRRLESAISLGGWHGKDAVADVVELVDEMIKRAVEKSKES
ncbi:hypothetical protein PP935_gp152 [Rhizobium phage RHph_N34]|uniref:Uncharacterized protein n=1 Tax=Rhizobium phage RHph_N34 TaxID=2509586 RepID=A0A7S5RAH4_9CAUD|nr:hypothetical protein PP935_gp152 [Rhizobium phage RHph_N34]QIG73927.1 hypothetical protein EVC06_152 [Rhizobium phage RHph_N34]